jgi:hypothetical protein
MYNNKAAFMMMKEDSYEFVQTVHVGHPYYLPNFMDGLTYSLPFVMENLSRLAEDLITICLPKADEHVPEDEQEEVERLRGKILALSRLRHVMGGLGEDRRQSIKQPAEVPQPVGGHPPKGATPGQLAKFEAALQMDFMREYLKVCKVGPFDGFSHSFFLAWRKDGRGLHQGPHVSRALQVAQLSGVGQDDGRQGLAHCAARAQEPGRAAAPQFSSRQKGRGCRGSRDGGSGGGGRRNVAGQQAQLGAARAGQGGQVWQAADAGRGGG